MAITMNQPTIQLPVRTGIRHIYTQYPWLDSIQPQKSLFQGKAYFFVKRALDLTLILFSLPLWLPVLLVCGLLVKLQDINAPIFFYQERTGKGGRRFSIYKFRTMIVNAEEVKEDLAAFNELKWPDFKMANDPRITKIGRLLRKTSLDEVPQILNVLKGEMSLVGPRPTSFSTDTYSLWHTERLDATPGITGLWQLLGRGATEFDDRLKFDIAYIERRCIWLDIQILFRTIAAVIQQRGAH